jgi:heterodisulfide reductase subunit A
MTDSVLIIGAGIAGLTAAEKIADAGARAVVIDRQPVVGGRLAATMTSPQAIGDRAEGQAVPLFESLDANERIEVLTNTTLGAIDGRAGSFDVELVERARFVTDACTRCKNCHTVCPVVLPNEFDAGLTFRKAIYTPMQTTYPSAWAVDIENCLNTPPNYLPCNRCVSVCDDQAIHFDQPLETRHRRHVGAIIVATGMSIGDGSAFADLGYGKYPDIVTSAELQRLLESPGPTGGYATRPSNEEYPESILLVLDEPSPFSLYIAASQAQQLLDQDIGEISVLALSQPASKDAATRLKETTGIEVHWGAALAVADSDDDQLAVSFEDFAAGKLVHGRYDLVVLYVDVLPSPGLEELTTLLDVPLGDDGYVAVAEGQEIATACPGILVVGCAAGPRTIRDSMANAAAAADVAVRELSPRVLGEPADKPGKVAPGDGTDGSGDVELRAQIERLLNALIDRV